MSDPALEHDRYYHIYNRGNNDEDLFFEERNYRYFLQLYAKHVLPVVDTYAYCLLRNHFHLLVRVRAVEEQPVRLSPSQGLGNLFNAYAKAVNKAYGRSGSLFENPFRRIEVTSDAYLAALVIYILQNPQRHGLVRDFRAWPFSAYGALLSERPTHLRRDEVLAWFCGADGLRIALGRPADIGALGALVAEDTDRP